MVDVSCLASVLAWDSAVPKIITSKTLLLECVWVLARARTVVAEIWLQLVLNKTEKRRRSFATDISWFVFAP